MENINNWNEIFFASMVNLWSIIIAYLPQIAGALIVLIVGLIVAGILGKIAGRLVGLTKIDGLIERIGLSGELEKVGLKLRVDTIIGKLVKWFFLIAVLIAVVDILNFPQLTSFLEQIALYLPNVIAAVIILVVGLILGRLAYNASNQSLEKLAISKIAANFLAAVAKWAIFTFALMAALIQLGIAVNLIQILFTGFVIMISLAGGLAFGLGGREKAAKILDWIDHEFGGKHR